jgi:large subunit ribosomal protein L21
MNYAIVEIGGTQHRVSPGDRLRVQRIEAEPGGTVTIDKVLLLQMEGDLKLGTPYVTGASITATVLSEAKGRKILVFKKKRRKQYRRTKGHRQIFTSLKIDQILPGS